LTIDNIIRNFEEKKMKINFNPISDGWLYKLWKQREETFIDYICLKYFLNQEQSAILTGVCELVKSSGRFTTQELRQIKELGIPLSQIIGFNLKGLRERKLSVSYDTFIEYLVNICDGKFTKEQIKQTIERNDNQRRVTSNRRRKQGNIY
jgi:hypothetical protein